MCWREFKTGIGYFTNDKGESEYFCPNCPVEFSELCHAGIDTPDKTKMLFEAGVMHKNLLGEYISVSKYATYYGCENEEQARLILSKIKKKEKKEETEKELPQATLF